MKEEFAHHAAAFPMLLLLPSSSLGTCSGEECPLGGDTDQLSLRIVPGPLLEACVINRELFLPQYPPGRCTKLGLRVRNAPSAPGTCAPSYVTLGKRPNLVRVWYVFYEGSYSNVLLRLCGRRGGSGRGPGTSAACRPGPSQVRHPGPALNSPWSLHFPPGCIRPSVHCNAGIPPSPA